MLRFTRWAHSYLVCDWVCVVVAVVVFCPFTFSQWKKKHTQISMKFRFRCRQFSGRRRRMYLKMNCESSVHSAQCLIHFKRTAAHTSIRICCWRRFFHYTRGPCAHDLMVCVRDCAFGRCCNGVRAAERPRLSFTQTNACEVSGRVVVNGRRTQSNENGSSKWCHLTVEWRTAGQFLIRRYFYFSSCARQRQSHSKETFCVSHRTMLFFFMQGFSLYRNYI